MKVCVADGGESDEDGADASEQDVRAVAVGGPAELTDQAAQPEDGLLRPGAVNVVDKEGCQQDEDEDPAHALQGVDAPIFDIQSLFLVEAVGVLNAGTAASLGVHLLGDLGVMDRDVGQQNDLALVVRVVSYDSPQTRVGVGQAQGQPAQTDGHPPHLVGMVEGHGETQRPGHGSRQFLQVLGAFQAP